MNERDIFIAARQKQNPAELAAFLNEACGDNADLRQRVLTLLGEQEQLGSFLESPAARLGATMDEPIAERPGGVIGPYKLLQQIGEGGMGTVWMAEQTQPVQRKVALKVIKPGMDSRQVIARFEAERQALAMMDHVNIARVFDGGAVGQPFQADSPSTSQPGKADLPIGRPYFVMELVHGVPITKYCDDNHLAPRERLELFVPVCQAIQHAHQKGIIHRDIKPSNVMVTLYDGKPVPKVIDFGVAKATEQKLTERTLFTQYGTMVGTLEYMSPEQAEMSALGADTRSDIYSLGVLLYELLTGSTPLSHKRLKEAGYAEILRIIKEEEPPRPSVRLSDSGEALASISANRHMEPAKLTKLVRGELDWIVMKCLEKDRNRRYETANGFAADVQRYLADEPVLAGPPSAWYRFRKFARRNRAQLAVAVALGLLLFVAGAFAWHADRQAAQRRADVAKQEGDERARVGRNAEAVATLLDQCEDALRADQPDRAGIALGAAERRAGDGGAEELAGRLARCHADLRLLRALNDIDTFRWTWAGRSFPDPKVVAARWRAALADYGLSADEGRAGEMAAKVNGSLVRERMLTALDGWLERDPSAAVRAALGAVLRSADPDPYRNAVRDAVAGRLARPVLALAGRPEALEQPPWFAATLGQLDLPPADRKRAVLESALRTKPGDLHLLMALGGSYRSTQPEGASERLRWYQAAVAVHPENLAARTNLGLALEITGNLDAALACFREIIRLDPKFALAHNNVGWILQQRGETEGAIKAYQDAIRADPKLALAYGNLATLLHNIRRDVVGAIAANKEAIRHDPKEPTCRNNLAWLLATGPAAMRDAKQAVEHATQACELTAWKNPDFISTLAAAHAESGDFDKAVGFQKKALAFVGIEKGLGKEFRDRLQLFEQKVTLANDDGTLRFRRAATLNAVPPIPLVVGALSKGALTKTDPPDAFHLTHKSHHRVHAVPLEAGQPYLIDLRGDFDTFLRIEDSERTPSLCNDDIRPDDLNSRLVFIPPQKGTYHLVVTSFRPGDTGAYALTVQKAVRVGEPTLVEDKLQDTDKKDRGKFFKMHTLSFIGGGSYTIELESRAFDTFLGLVDSTGKQVLAENDDIAPGNSRSRLDFTPKADATFTILVTSFEQGETGAYRLTVQRYEAVKEKTK